jgi:hypothetical protein
MSGRFDDHGVSFAYSRDWTLETDSDGELSNITIAAPDGVAFAIIRVDRSRPEPEAVLEETLDVLRSEYPRVEIEDADELIGGSSALGVDLEFLQFDVSNTCVLRCLRSERSTIMFLGQWSELEGDEVGETIRALKDSLMISDVDEE